MAGMKNEESKAMRTFSNPRSHYMKWHYGYGGQGFLKNINHQPAGYNKMMKTETADEN
jgi:hypothetical protein